MSTAQQVAASRDMKHARFRQVVDAFFSKCEENNLTIVQATRLLDLPSRNEVRRVYEEWRTNRLGERRAVFDHTLKQFENGLTAFDNGPVKAEFVGDRPSQLIRRKGAALFTNGRALYKAPHKLSGKGPRHLVRITPKGKAIDWKEALQARAAAIGVGDESVEEPAPQPRGRGKGKRGAGGKFLPKLPKVVAQGLANKPPAPSDWLDDPTEGPLPTGVDDLLRMRDVINAKMVVLKDRRLEVEAALQAQMDRIAEVLTRSSKGPISPAVADSILEGIGAIARNAAAEE